MGVFYRGSADQALSREFQGATAAALISNSWFDRVGLNYLYVQTLALTDAQTPFLGTPLVPLRLTAKALQLGAERRETAVVEQGLIYMYTYIYIYIYMLYICYIYI